MFISGTHYSDGSVCVTVLGYMFTRGERGTCVEARDNIICHFQWFFTLVPVTLSYWSWSLSIQLDWLPSKFHRSLISDSLALELQVNATIPNFKISAYCVHILYVYVYSIKIELKHFSLPFLFHPPYIPSLDLFPCSHIIKLIAFFSWIIIVTHAYMGMQNYVCDSCFNQLLYNF